MSDLERKLYAYYEEISSEGIYIETEFYEEGDAIEVMTKITAPKRGDEALMLVAETLQSLANQHRRTFIHIGIPTIPAAEKLFVRNPNYRLSDDKESWKRTFEPQTNIQKIQAAM